MMGMFDYVTYEGEEYQTKSLECCLYNYNIIQDRLYLKDKHVNYTGCLYIYDGTKDIALEIHNGIIMNTSVSESKSYWGDTEDSKSIDFELSDEIKKLYADMGLLAFNTNIKLSIEPENIKPLNETSVKMHFPDYKYGNDDSKSAIQETPIHIEKEHIIISAIHIQDNIHYNHQPKGITSGYVVTGYRHSNCFATMGILCPDLSYKSFKIEQGFLTNENRFIDRKTSYELAISNGQFKDDGRNNKILFSEDLWKI